MRRFSVGSFLYPKRLQKRMVETSRSHEYQDYELPVEERTSLKDIEKRLRDGVVKEERDIRDYLDFLENVDARIQEALAVERSIGRSNVTLKHDSEKVMSLMRRLKDMLDEVDKF
jgi:hypothetical protein